MFIDPPSFTGGSAAGLAVILLPLAFNRFVLPLVSRDAKIAAYLRVLNSAAEKYRAEFPERFDDPNIKWRDYAAQVVRAAARAERIPPSDKVWLLAQKIFLNYGLGGLPKGAVKGLE